MRLIILLFLFSNGLFAQYNGAQIIDESDLSTWLPKFEIEYAGVYQFGESESESKLILIINLGKVVAQIQGGYWEEGTGVRKSYFVNLTNVRIDKRGGFTSDQYSGVFVKYEVGQNKFIKGLRINNPWSDWIPDNSFEVGLKASYKLAKIYAGKYPEASFRLLSLEDLNRSAQELRLMINEIYARYGYIFRKGGAMDNYFTTQNWYRPQHDDVSSFLTEIELENIEMIRSKME